MRFVRWLRQRSLSFQILCVVVPMLLVSVLLVVETIYSSARQSRRQEAYYQLENFSNINTLQLEERLNSILDTVISIERSDAFMRLLLGCRYGFKTQNSYADRVALRNTLETVYAQNRSLVDSIYLRVNDTELTYMERSFPRFSPPDLASLYARCSSGSPYLWQAPHLDTIFTAVPREVFSLVKFFGDPAAGGRMFGAIVLNIRRDYLFDVLDSVPIAGHGYWLLLADGAIYPAAAPGSAFALPGGAEDFLLENCGMTGHFESHGPDGAPLYVYFDRFGNNGWGLAAVMPTAELRTHIPPMEYRNLLLLLLVLAVLLAFTVIFVRRITFSLRELSGRVQRFDAGALPTAQFHLEGSREVTILSDALDSMAAAIHSLLRDVYNKQRLLRQTELAALQAQIKPHFIYNALSTVLYEVDGGQTRPAGEMLRQLITFFRLSVNRGSDVSTVADELSHAESYLRIQQIRRSCDFSYEIHAEADLYDNEMLQFTLQPLVENCLVHGFVGSTAAPHICITVEQEGPDICIEVFDNGAGIAPQALQRLKAQINADYTDVPTAAYGLKNVNLRIRLHYGGAYGLSIESRAGEYTLVRVRLPRRAHRL